MDYITKISDLEKQLEDVNNRLRAIEKYYKPIEPENFQTQQWKEFFDSYSRAVCKASGIQIVD